jgi:uncharacterized protein YegP (UPF0339 family)
MNRGTLHFERDTAGGWRWRLRAANGAILAVSSEAYTRLTDAHRGWADTIAAIADVGGADAPESATVTDDATPKE